MLKIISSYAAVIIFIVLCVAKFIAGDTPPFPTIGSGSQGVNQIFIDAVSKLSSKAGERILNETSVSGGHVILRCSVNGKGDVVVWMDKYDNVLYYNQDRIIDDSRFELMKQGEFIWNLRISNLAPRDSGKYRCLTNTETIQSILYDLIVYIPAKIDRALSSEDIMAREGSNISLICNATGYPDPTVTWTVHRSNSTEAQAIPDDGEVLTIYNIKRFCDDIYTCKANNNFGVPDYHMMRVRVRFSPEVTLLNHQQSQVVGKTTILTCKIRGFPLGSTFWSKDGFQINDNNSSSPKYKYEFYDHPNKWERQMSLAIINVQQADYGQYRCVAATSIGSDHAYMELYKDGMHVQYTEPTVETVNRYPWTQTVVNVRTIITQRKTIPVTSTTRSVPKWTRRLRDRLGKNGVGTCVLSHIYLLIFTSFLVHLESCSLD